jgi:hypothetical protein
MKKIVTLGLVLFVLSGLLAAEDAIAVDSDGNVDINPQTTLNVNGDMEISGDVQTSGNFVSSDPGTITGLHYFLSSEVVPLWGEEGGGPYVEDLTQNVPKNAKGAILKVLVNPTTRANGSFVVADRKGLFSENLMHFSQNGFTNYASTWVGGTVFVFFITDSNGQVPDNQKQFSWKTASDEIDFDPVIRTYASLIGWF